MPASDQEILDLAASTQVVANLLKDMIGMNNQLIDQNATQAIDWNAMDNTTHPELVGEDGYFIGKNYKPSDVANFVGILSPALVNMWTNQAVATSTYGVFTEKLAAALVGQRSPGV